MAESFFLMDYLTNFGILRNSCPDVVKYYQMVFLKIQFAAFQIALKIL